MKRLIYLAYYLHRMKWRTLWRFMDHVEKESGISRVRQAVAVIADSLRYNISPLEVYQFGFFDADHEEKASWAGTGTMYEFQRRANPPEYRDILEDKAKFFKAYRRFVRHDIVTRNELAGDIERARVFLGAHENLVFKPARGNCGAGIAFVKSTELDAETLAAWMERNGYDLAEECVAQHPDLQTLSPSGVNTVRIFTCLDNANCAHILGCRLRISVNSPVDNLAAGNLAAPVEDQTGRVCGAGVYSDITKQPEPVHPVTGVAIDGFPIPFWAETVALAREAAEMHPQNRSIGWDIVITPTGPGLIEGNHDWCKLVWQLPVGRGLKQSLQLCS